MRSVSTCCAAAAVATPAVIMLRAGEEEDSLSRDGDGANDYGVNVQAGRW